MTKLSDIVGIQLAWYHESGEIEHGHILNKESISIPFSSPLLPYLNVFQELWIFFPSPVDFVRVEVAHGGIRSCCPVPVYYQEQMQSLEGTGGIMYAYDQSYPITYNDLPQQKILPTYINHNHLLSFPSSNPSNFLMPSNYCAQCELFIDKDVQDGALIIQKAGITAVLLIVWDFRTQTHNDLTINDVFISECNGASIHAPVISRISIKG